MTNPVKGANSQLPIVTADFFEADGRTISKPWRAFFRTLETLTGANSGGTDLTDLIKQVQAQAADIADLFALDSAQAGAMQFGIILSRLMRAEQNIQASVVAPARPGIPAAEFVRPALPRFFPATHGTAGQVLMSLGATTPATWGAPNIFPIRTVTTAGTIAALVSDYTVKCDATLGAQTYALTAAAQNAGRIVYVKKINSSANTVTIKANGSELIDGANTVVLSAQWSAVQLHCDGTVWAVI